MNITATIPATTANLGPGFDCLGLALALYNQVSFAPLHTGLEVVVKGEGAGLLPTDGSNLVVQAANRVFARLNRRPAGLRIVQKNHIPVGSGLGSSAAAVLGGLLAANEMVQGDLTPDDLLRMAVEMEGHPDNAAAALYGGLVIVNQEEDHWHVEQVSIPQMNVVVVMPQVVLSTVAARSALPATVPLRDAVFNAGRVAVLVQALAQADFDKLAWATQDRLHEPFRRSLIPGAGAARAAGLAAGADAVVLSGAGPSLLAFAQRDHEQIAAAMQDTLNRENVTGRIWILSLDVNGATIV